MTSRSSHFRNDTAALKNILLAELPRLLDHLFAGRTVQRIGHEYRIGTHGSLSIRTNDGSYFNHETGEGGDLLALIAHTLRMDFKGALAWVKAFIGHDTRCQERSFARITCARAREETQENIREQRQREKALAMLKRSTPIQHTLAERYLRQYRGITLAPLPENLAFLPRAYNYTARASYPAMLAPICDVRGDIISIHLTFLDPTTGNKSQSRNVKSRLILGSCRGGSIHLAPATHRLALCEGIEDGLSVMQCTPDWPVWVTGGTSNLRGVQIPPQVREVMICADGDEAGMTAAQALSTRLIAEGKAVRIATPPAPHKDFNAALLAEVHHD